MRNLVRAFGNLLEACFIFDLCILGIAKNRWDRDCDIYNRGYQDAKRIYKRD